MKKTVLLSLVLVASLGACASSGNKSVAKTNNDEVRKEIVVGKTTKKDVEAKYGKPQGIESSSNGGEVWTYSYSQAQTDVVGMIPVVSLFAGGIDSNTKTVTITFDKKGVARDVKFNEQNQRVGNG